MERSSATQVHSLADVAWIEIREQILNGQLSPGETVGLKEQAERLGISIMPVRDAVKRLQHEGLVVQIQQREAYVAPLSLENMEDVYSIRAALESLAIERACRNFGQEHFDRLSRVLDQFAGASENSDVRAAREFHRRFHLDLYALAGSPTLDRLIPPLIDATERYRVFSQSLRGSVRQRTDEHQSLLLVCLSGDAEAARAQLASHLMRTVEDVRRSLELFAARRTEPRE